MEKHFYSNGKLLLTGEYAVLDGALALAVPTKYGQSLSVKAHESSGLHWKSLDEHGKIWFEAIFNIEQFSWDAPSVQHTSIAEKLSDILREAKKLNPDFLEAVQGYQVETKLDFSRDWGLGSSSTLINNIAQWAEVDAYKLLWNAFAGSGYDIACAQSDHPIIYHLEEGKPSDIIADFNPPFKNQLYFVHLNKKQNSREGIGKYREMEFDNLELVKRLSEITRRTVSCTSLSEFEVLMTEHETLLSKALSMPTVKTSLFPDFKGAIKSLGAWGGDFILATGNEKVTDYFRKKGYITVIQYPEMVLGMDG